jgi:hypothetical protein
LAVGDISFRLKCYQRILDLREQGTVIVLVSHQPIDLLRVIHTGVWLQTGRLLGTGPIHTLLNDYVCAQRVSHATGSAIVANPAATIVDVSLSPETVVTHGQTECRILIQAHQDIPALRLLVHIEAADGILLGSFASNLSSFTPSLITGRHLVAFQLSEIPLVSGSYFVHVALHGPKVEDIYDHWRHKTILQVKDVPPDPFGFGVYHHVYFKHRWLPVKDL